MTTTGMMMMVAVVAAAAHPQSCATIAKEKKTAGTTSTLQTTNTIVTGVASVSGVAVTAGQTVLVLIMFRVPIVTHQEKWVNQIQPTRQAMDIVTIAVAVADAVNVAERATNKDTPPTIISLTI